MHCNVKKNTYVANNSFAFNWSAPGTRLITEIFSLTLRFRNNSKKKKNALFRKLGIEVKRIRNYSRIESSLEIIQRPNLKFL